jgi:glycolate oxidase FAD binding subunit
VTVARTLAPWQRELADVVPADGVRPATEADAVGGVQPAIVVEPSGLEEATAVLRLASARRLAVAPVGGGTKLGWGNPPDRLDLILSTRRMDRVIDHAPGDLVVRAEAGVPLAALQERLAAAGQFLALDPPHASAGATLGGIVATAAAGPRRLRYGTPRDLLIGITYVLPDGGVARAGGRVVKNVAGYDLMKLFAGSLGTLGLIAEVTFRLHPMPAAARWVGGAVTSPEQAGAAVRAVLDDRGLEPAALELSWPAGSGRLDVLFEGSEAGVTAQADRALRGLSGAGLAAVEEGPPPTVRAEPGEGDVTVKLAHPPASLPGALHAIREATDRRGDVAAPDVFGQAASGVTYVALPGAWPADAARRAIEDLRGWAFGCGGSAVVLDGPVAVREGLDAWGPVGDAFALTRRVKERFDPGRVLNPGRFVGGI